MPADYHIAVNIRMDIENHWAYIYVENSILYLAYRAHNVTSMASFCQYSIIGSIQPKCLRKSKKTTTVSGVLDCMRQIAPLESWEKLHQNSSEFRKFCFDYV
jgi:hypothetical protein